MRAFALVIVAIALAAATIAQRSGAVAAQPGGATEASPMLGISYRSAGGALAWFDPRLLRTLPGRKAPLGGNFGSWSFSADRSIFAIASCGDAGNRPIRFVNARAMRVLGDLRVAPSADCLRSLTWLRPRRLLVIVDTGVGSSVVVVDPLARRVLRRLPLPTAPSAIAATTDELVLLLAEQASFAPARVLSIDADGQARTVTVDHVLAGTVVDESGTRYRARTIQPGLAADSSGRRAFLVPASGSVAEIDLVTLAVSYHELDRPSPLGRFLRWFTPAAQAKEIEGPVREARWLGDGMLAVSGMDYSLEARSDATEFVQTPAGVRLIDTRSWESKMLEPQSTRFAVAPGLVITQGGRWDSGFGPGLHAFGLDGEERWRLYAGEYRWLDAAGSVGYAYTDGVRTDVVDLETGELTARGVGSRLPQLLTGQESHW